MFKMTKCCCMVLFMLGGVPAMLRGQDDEWTAFQQVIDAKPYVGKHFAYTGYVRTDGNAGGMMWFRVDCANKRMGFFDNMNDRPVIGKDWEKVTIDGVIDSSAVQLNMGGLCTSNGDVYFDDVSFHVETTPGQWENVPLKNNGFETVEGKEGVPDGWFALHSSSHFIYMPAPGSAHSGKNALLVKGIGIEDNGNAAYGVLGRFVRDNYTKQEYQVAMRDGVKLYTIVYVPKDASATNAYPILMNRTPYSVGPYGKDKYMTIIGPSGTMIREKYIFVEQDVRGRYMSEGVWTNMTPRIAKKGLSKDVDESSDTYDTVDWLLKNISFNNGKVGLWGISYPGFYSTAGSIDAHPALKAVSPQAPVADFFFDDFHHNGAFTQGYFWNFPLFGTRSAKPTADEWWSFFEKPTPDSYDFYLKNGPLRDLGDRYYKDNFLWQEITTHNNYDDFWQKRRIVQYLDHSKPAFLVVGGWFDAEDLYGALTTYKENEQKSPGSYNTIVMGPFGHGDWAWETVHYKHHDIYFGDSLVTFYQRNIEAKFFAHFLKGSGDGQTGLPEAYMFNTGEKVWKQYTSWPPVGAVKQSLYFQEGHGLSFKLPVGDGYDAYVSDPAKPVPYTMDVAGSFGITPRNYMSEDQRFAASRPDVLVFETDTLTADVTLGGAIGANLFVSSTGTDADWVVKLIDVYPGYEKNSPYTPKNVTLAGYQQMVRSEVMRSRFRNGFDKSVPLVAGQVTPINFHLQDVLHTFKRGHRIMVQVQSSWFPLIDLNPQQFLPNIYKAGEKDFMKATQRVYHSGAYPSRIEVEVLP